uniref:DUF7903 domain-containing protein n=1 Tax=Brassica oleracea TaxID=3712 RepID=A0A3P6AZH6_BRAOL|nr:unnamed protein product [Brassica oleracea]
MSYIPPHKRHSKDPVRPSPFPESLVTKLKKNNDFKSSFAKSKVITYSRDSISKWLIVSSNGIEDEVPPSVKLVPVSSDSSECSRYGETSLVLINTSLHKAEESEEEEKSRWMLVAEKVENDILFAYEQAKKGMEDYHLSDNGKLRLVARFGKLIFYRRQAGHVTEYSQENMNMIFSTDVPTYFIQNIKSKAISSHEFCIGVEKEVYVVQISHNTRPYAEMNPLRHLVVDVSCIDKNLDMRLMVAGKRKIMNLTEKETHNIQGLLDSVTVDSKEGLKWLLGKPSSLNGYKILEVCHVRATTYKNRTLRLRVREADRFNERFRTREVERGVTLILQDINTKLQEPLNFRRRLKGSDMSYIPPHKRHSKDPDRPSPVPDSLENLKSSNAYGKVITYSRDSISKWFLVSSNGIEDEVPPSIKLVPMSSDSSECIRYGENYLVLTNTTNVLMSQYVCIKNMLAEESEEEEKSRWMLVAEKVEKDLVFAYEQAKKTMEDHHHLSDNAKLRLVARFGKLLFRRRQGGPVTEYWQQKTNRIFSTDVPTSFIQNINSKAIPSHEFCIDMEKEVYVLQISQYTRPHATIKCKCTVKDDGSLSMYKARLERPLHVRHLVVDVSCIDKNLDMRLMLAAKRKITSPTEKEISDIKGLLDSATVDPNVKGGLRWPFGKSSSGDGYSVFESCHVKATVYKNQTLRLRVRETDRFDERIGTGEVKREVILMLKDMNSKLQEQNVDRGCVLEMLRDVLGTLWDFLHCEAYLT